MKSQDNEKIPTYLAANRLAEERIASVARSRKQFLQKEKHILNKAEII